MRFSKDRLKELVEEATVDAYGDEEQASGLFTMLEDNLRLPFTTRVLGADVTVEAIDLTGDNQIMAVCRKGSSRQRIPLNELPLPSPPPEGTEWIEAYRYWRSGFE